MEEEVVITPNKDHYVRPRHSVTRFLAGLVDFVLVMVSTVLLFNLASNTVLKNTGLNEAKESLIQIYEDSHLFVESNGSLYMVNSYYDKTLTPEENYDEKITYFYTNYQPAVEANKLDEYIQAKVDSGFYNVEGDVFTRKDDADDTEVQTFYEEQYTIACNYLFTDEQLLADSATVLKISLIAISIIVAVVCFAFLILIPLIDKKGRTLSYMFFNLCLVDSRTQTPKKKSLIVVRNLIYSVFAVIFLIDLYVISGNLILALTPFLVNLIFIICTPSKSCVHDLICKTLVFEKQKKNHF